MSASDPLHDTFLALSALARGQAGSGSLALSVQDKGKGDFDPVTALDRAIERDMRAHLSSQFPDHGVWGEEEGWTNEGAPIHWSLDPVDGTRALVCGLPSWCVLAGLIENGRHVAGMIDCPSLDELLVAVEVPIKKAGARHFFHEYARRTGDYAIAGLAAQAVRDGDVLSDLRLAYFAVGDRPVLATASRHLVGKPVTLMALADARAALDDELDPQEDQQASASMRRYFARQLMERCVVELLERPDLLVRRTA